MRHLKALSIAILAAVLLRPAPASAAASITVTNRVSPGGSITAGRNVEYTIVVTNTGDTTLTALEVVDTLSPVVVNAPYPVSTFYPAGFTETVSDIAGGGTLYTWSNPSFSMGCRESLTFTLTGLVSLVCSDIAVSNEAIAEGDGTDSVSASSGFTAAAPVAGLSVTTSWANASNGTQTPAPQRGSVVTFTVTVRNTGWATVENVMINDTLPTLTGAVSGVPQAVTGWTVDSTTTGTGGMLLLTLTKPAMLQGESVTYSFNATVDSAEQGLFDVLNRVWARYLGPTPCSSTRFAVPGAAQIPLTTAANERAVSPIAKDSSIVYPSPARGDKAFIAFYLETAAVVKVRVYSQQGLLLYTTEEYNNAGPAQCAVSTGKLAPGVYYYTVEVNVPGGRSIHKPRKLVVAR